MNLMCLFLAFLGLPISYGHYQHCTWVPTRHCGGALIICIGRFRLGQNAIYPDDAKREEINLREDLKHLPTVIVGEIKPFGDACPHYNMPLSHQGKSLCCDLLL